MLCYRTGCCSGGNSCILQGQHVVPAYAVAFVSAGECESMILLPSAPPSIISGGHVIIVARLWLGFAPWGIRRSQEGKAGGSSSLTKGCIRRGHRKGATSCACQWLYSGPWHDLSLAARSASHSSRKTRRSPQAVSSMSCLNAGSPVFPVSPPSGTRAA